jgi:hypothetical protein
LVCLDCKALWCFASHGRSNEAVYGLSWPYSALDWQRSYDLDDGVSLARWHLKNFRQTSGQADHPCGLRVCGLSARKKD